MHRIVRIAVLLLAIITPALAGPLQKENIPADAKWLLHWDLEKYRNTDIGRYCEREVLPQKLEKLRTHFKQHFNLDIEWEKYTSLTIYGTEFESTNNTNGVLLIKTDSATAKAAETTLIRQAGGAKSQGGSIEAIATSSGSLFAINNILFISIQKDGRILAGKSLSQVRKGIDTLRGGSPNFASSHAFASFPATGNDPFLIAMAEGIGDHLPLPSNAKILQNAEAVRAVLREKKDKLSLNLVLKANSADACKQLQQAILGLIAFVNISQQDNKELIQMAQSASIAASDRLVSLDLNYPVKDAIVRLSEFAGSEPVKIPAK